MANVQRTGIVANVGNENVSLMQLNEATDMMIEEVIVTTGYFTGGVGTITGGASALMTASIADSNEDYYFDITDGVPTTSTTETQFSVAYGHYAGTGSVSGSTNKGQTEAIYKQFASMLLAETEITGGWFISGSARDDEVYVLVAERA